MRVDVSILICSHNRANHLSGTLDSLGETPVPAGRNVELILIDNASTDNTLSVMRSFDHPNLRVRVVREEVPGLSVARNRGISEAKGRVLLFTDDDVRLPQNWIEEMCGPILRNQADAVAGGVELAPEIQEDWMTPRHRTILASTEHISSSKPDRMVGANMAIGRHVFDVVHKFDPELGAGRLGRAEETVFAWQMLQAGFKIVSAFDVKVTHIPDKSRISEDSLLKVAIQDGRVQGYLDHHYRGLSERSPLLLQTVIAFNRVKLKWWRINPLYKERRNDPACFTEYNLLVRIWRAKQRIAERGRQSRYAIGEMKIRLAGTDDDTASSNSKKLVS